MQKRPIVLLLAGLLATAPLAAFDQGKGKGKGHGKSGVKDARPGASAHAPGHGATPPGHGGVPPGLAKRLDLPPGLAKKFGRTVESERVYVAFDPRRHDRAWVLEEDRWVERRGFDPALRLEVRHALDLPPIPHPPVPLPIARLHVVLFGD